MEEKEFHSITEDRIRAIGAYEIEEHRYLPDINSDSFLLRHKKTGARIAILPNGDTNKVFYIAFRTPPKDSTGVAHIIEHTVLCGSRDFPVKDPFIEVVKGSLNTFLNAMTYPDKTVYPVASTNEKDFDNLMHVYLDAVFHPNIYTEQNIFRQEGWHYEMPEREDQTIDENGEITVNGVVYNEMKGAMSSPDDVLNDKVLATLFPDTTYSIVSGGDPDVIPTLTYEAYLDFHRRYYHPSNSYIFLYGDMDMEERLRYLDEAYLGQYEHLAIDSAIRRQKEFTEPVEASFPYAILDGEDPEGKAYLSYNLALPMDVLPGKERQKLNLAFRVLDVVLCDSEGAPVKEALRRKGIGQDVDSLYDAGVLEPYWSVTAKYAREDQKGEFVRTIEDTLGQIVREGLDPKSVLAGINTLEFHYREADFGSYPKGLIFGLDMLDSWLYSDEAAWDNLELGGLFDELRRDAAEGAFEKIIRKWILENPHKSIVLLTPDPGMTKRSAARQKEKMKAFAQGLSAGEKHQIALDQESLRKFQETPDTEENLRRIPLLSRQDLGQKALPYVNELRADGDLNVMTHPLFTGGIDYMTFVFDITDFPKKLFPYLGIFKTVFGVLDTEHYSYAELDHEINIWTGGIGGTLSAYNNAHNPDQYRVTFEVSCKVLHENVSHALELVKEILTGTKYRDGMRIREVLEEERSAARTDLAESGHGTAAGRAASYFSRTGAIMDLLSGIGGYRTLDRICTDFDEAEDELKQTLEAIAENIFRPENLLFDITGSAEQIDEVIPKVRELEQSLFGGIGERTQTADGEPLSGKLTDDAPFRPVPVQKNEAFTTAGQVQFVCRAGNFLNKGYAYTGALRVLKVILGYDYLWKRIRMKGGAYGCMSGFAKDGTAYFVTFRDPHLLRSVETFEKAGEYLRSFDADERTMTQYVIGAVSSLDRPLTPSMYGRYGLSGYLANCTMEDRQKERDEVLGCDAADIRALGGLVDAFLRDGCICVVGRAGKIEEHKELFRSIEPLT